VVPCPVWPLLAFVSRSLTSRVGFLTQHRGSRVLYTRSRWAARACGRATAASPPRASRPEATTATAQIDRPEPTPSRPASDWRKPPLKRQPKRRTVPLLPFFSCSLLFNDGMEEKGPRDASPRRGRDTGCQRGVARTFCRSVCTSSSKLISASPARLYLPSCVPVRHSRPRLKPRSHGPTRSKPAAGQTTQRREGAG